MYNHSMHITNPRAVQETGNGFEKRPNTALLIPSPPLHYSLLFNCFFHYTNYNKIQKCSLGSYLLQQSGQLPFPLQGIRVSNKEHQDRLKQGPPKGLLPRQGRLPQHSRPDRHYGCISAIRCALQDETDRPSYPLIWQ
jgi:hypothetical protein